MLVRREHLVADGATDLVIERWHLGLDILDHPKDVVMLVKARMHDDALSQPPFLFITNERLDALPKEPTKVRPMNPHPRHNAAPTPRRMARCSSYQVNKPQSCWRLPPLLANAAQAGGAGGRACRFNPDLRVRGQLHLKDSFSSWGATPDAPGGVGGARMGSAQWQGVGRGPVHRHMGRPGPRGIDEAAVRDLPARSGSAYRRRGG